MRLPRNPGPSWGPHAIRTLDRALPQPIFTVVCHVATWIAVLLMKEERRHSRAYLTAILERPPSLRDVHRHFLALTSLLVLKLRVAENPVHEVKWAPGAEDLRRALENQEQALLGSFHLGHSDLVGFMFARRLKQRIAMVRERRGNAGDVEQMLKQFGDWITMIWVNESENLLFALKQAVAEGRSIAMKCDRHAYSAKTAAFRFLGARRRFPTTIYHLALIFNLPVLHAYALPTGAGESVVSASPEWRPDPALRRDENLARAHAHFQAFLDQVEADLRGQPYQWLNFIALNPEVES